MTGAIPNGALGLHVPKLVEMGVGAAVDHAPIPLQVQVERNAQIKDQTHNTKTAMMEAVQVYGA